LVLERAFQDSFEGRHGGRSVSLAYWTQTDPDFFPGLV
jgi:hypothetical protein